MYAGRSPTERGDCEPDEDPLVTENNRLTDRIAELTSEVAELAQLLRLTNAAWDASEKFNDAFDDHRYGYGATSQEQVDLARAHRDSCMRELNARNALREGK